MKYPGLTFEIMEDFSYKAIMKELDTDIEKRNIRELRMINWKIRLNIIGLIVYLIVLWIASTTIIQAFECPELTQTELFLNIHHSALLDFENCD